MNSNEFWDQRVNEALASTSRAWRNYNYYFNTIYGKLATDVLTCLSFAEISPPPALLKTDLWDTIVEKDRSVIAVLPTPLKENITIVDVSPELVALARKTLDVKVVQGDLRNLPFPNSSFDAILDCSTIDHINEHDIQKVINEYERVLNDAGTLLIVYARNSFIIKLANILFRKFFRTSVYNYYENKYGQFFFTDNSIIDRIRENPELRIRRNYYFGFLLHFPSKNKLIVGLFNIIPKFFLRFISSLELTPGVTLLFRPFSLFGAVLVQKQMNLKQIDKY